MVKGWLQGLVWEMETPTNQLLLLQSQSTYFQDHVTKRNDGLWRDGEWASLSLLLRRFFFRMAEASAKRVTGDEPQGTMGRVQTADAFRHSRPQSPSFLGHVVGRLQIKPSGSGTRMWGRRLLSPSRLPLRARFHQERDVWVRSRASLMTLDIKHLTGPDRSWIRHHLMYIYMSRVNDLSS